MSPGRNDDHPLAGWAVPHVPAWPGVPDERLAIRCARISIR
jgi:hypothetical protein